jgi:hypothetical protein
MVATLERMAREKKPPTETVRLAREMVRRINRIAAHRDMTVPDYLLEKLGPIVDADEAGMLADLKKELGDECRPKKK